MKNTLWLLGTIICVIAVDNTYVELQRAAWVFGFVICLLMSLLTAIKQDIIMRRLRESVECLIENDKIIGGKQ